ncbi:unnamed protein product [Linum trigynum]|uniref:Defensin n=1 Tax=Linum trigynum TaxID=586398 RepID=A0AAV2FPP9_9ROSI
MHNFAQKPLTRTMKTTWVLSIILLLISVVAIHVAEGVDPIPIRKTCVTLLEEECQPSKCNDDCNLAYGPNGTDGFCWHDLCLCKYFC